MKGRNGYRYGGMDLRCFSERFVSALENVLQPILNNPIRIEKGRDGYDSTDIFEFKWSTSLLFDRNMSNLRSEVKVIEYYWDQKVKEATKQKLR